MPLRHAPDPADAPFDPDAPVPLCFEDELDLHRFHPRDAPALLRDWLSDRRRAGCLALRLVHGKGTGQLRARVHGILRSSGLVRALREDGNWGGVQLELWDPAEDEARVRALLGGLSRWRAALDALDAVGPPGAWLGAGALRNRVWHHLHGRPGEPEDRDLDVAWVGAADPAEDAAWTERLRRRLDAPWEVVDQRRYGHPDALAGVASWPETATTVAARGAALHAAWGWEDLWALVVRPRPGFPAEAWRARIAAKRWRERFPGVVVERP